MTDTAKAKREKVFASLLKLQETIEKKITKVIASPEGEKTEKVLSIQELYRLKQINEGLSSLLKNEEAQAKTL